MLRGECMREQLLLLIRISKPEYNKTLYNGYKLFMNPQMIFKKSGLTEGQYDKYEGAITNIPCKILYSTDEKKSWNLLGNTSLMYKDNNAYIYCMYGVKYDEKHYDAENNKYYYVIPWEYIEPLWQGDGTELMVIKNTSVFIDKFKKAAMDAKFSYAYGKVHYDLDDKLSNIEYYDLAMKDHFASVYHKVKESYEIQHEVRFSVICPDKPEHIELQLVNDKTLHFTLIPLKYGRHILVELSDLEFDKEFNLPVRFSSEIKYYESENDTK